MASKTVPASSCEDIITTGMCARRGFLVTAFRRPMPSTPGIITSVTMMSNLLETSPRSSRASSPPSATVTL